MGSRFTEWGQNKPPVGWKVNPQAAADLGLIGAWLLNEDGGLLAFDVSENNNTGTLTNTPKWVEDRYGPCLSLTDSSSQYVDLGTTLNSKNANAISIVGLVRNTANSIALQPILTKDFDGSFVPFNLALQPGQANSGMAFYDGSWHSSGVNTDIRADGLWHLVSGTWNGTTASYYIDRNLDSSAAPGGTRSTAGTGHAAIGAYLNGSGYWAGQIAYVLLSRSVLTIDQIQSLYADPFYWMQAPKRRLFNTSAVSPVVGIPVFLLSC